MRLEKAPSRPGGLPRHKYDSEQKHYKKAVVNPTMKREKRGEKGGDRKEKPSSTLSM